MPFSPEVIAEIKRRNPYATDEMISILEKELGGLSGKTEEEIIRDSAINTAGSMAAKEGLNAVSEGAGDVVPVAGAAYNAYDIAKNDKLTKEQQAQNVVASAGNAAAAYYTGGLSALARYLASKTGEGKKFEARQQKELSEDPTTLDYWKKPQHYRDPWGFMRGMFIKGIEPFMGGMSTKNKQKSRAIDLINKDITGYTENYGWNKINDDLYKQAFGKFLEGARKSRSDLDPSFVGMDPKSNRWVNNAFATSGKVEDLRPEDVWGGQGVFSTFGNDWLGKYNEEQRRKISQGLLDAALFKLDHGDVIISDRDKALAVRNEILGGDQGAPTFGPSEEEKEKEENAN